MPLSDAQVAHSRASPISKICGLESLSLNPHWHFRKRCPEAAEKIPSTSDWFERHLVRSCELMRSCMVIWSAERNLPACHSPKHQADTGHDGKHQLLKGATLGRGSLPLSCPYSKYKLQQRLVQGVSKAPYSMTSYPTETNKTWHDFWHHLLLRSYLKMGGGTHVLKWLYNYSFI